MILVNPPRASFQKNPLRLFKKTRSSTFVAKELQFVVSVPIEKVGNSLPKPPTHLRHKPYAQNNTTITFIRRAIGDKATRDVLQTRAFIRCNSNNLLEDFSVNGF